MYFLFKKLMFDTYSNIFVKSRELDDCQVYTYYTGISTNRDASAYFLGSQSRGLYEMDIFLEGGREDMSHVTYDCLIIET